MGFVKRLVGGTEPKAQPVNTTTPVSADAASSQAVAREDKKRKQALIASNAGTSGGASTVGTGSPNITSKTLLGL